LPGWRGGHVLGAYAMEMQMHLASPAGSRRAGRCGATRRMSRALRRR